MTVEPHYAELASKLLAGAVPEAAPPREEDRLLAIRAVERAMRQKAKRRFAVRAALVGSIAASLALYFGVTRVMRPVAIGTSSNEPVAELVRGSAVAVRGAETVPLSSNVVLGKGDRIVTAAASNARIKLATGTTLLVEEEGDLAIVEPTSNQVFSLAVGAMRADVAKLTVGERFVIRTEDAEFEGRSTSFRVARVRGAPPCGDGLTTKLSVFEGVVAARAHDRQIDVGAGQEWSAPCETPATVPVAKGSTSPSAVAASASAAVAPSPSVAQPRGLQPMNDLFAEAMDAKARGDKTRAVSLLQRLEARYPASPLAESATVERMKILVSTNPKAAAVLARHYLATYPDGFARDLAQGLVAKDR